MNQPRNLESMTLHELCQHVAKATRLLANRIATPDPLYLPTGAAPGSRLAQRLATPGSYKGENALEDVMKDSVATIMMSPQQRDTLLDARIARGNQNRDTREAEEIFEQFHNAPMLPDDLPVNERDRQILQARKAKKIQKLFCVCCGTTWEREKQPGPEPRLCGVCLGDPS